MQRVPLETNYLEAYNRDNVHLVDISETPIERVTEKGLRTTAGDYEFDIIVYATGFDAITGAYDLIDITGIGGEKAVRQMEGRAVDLPRHAHPRLSEFADADRAAERLGHRPTFRAASRTASTGARICCEHMWDRGLTRADPTREAEERWTAHVTKMYAIMLMRKAKGWFTGYNSNVPGHEEGRPRYFVYNGGTPKYVAIINDVAAKGYEGLVLSSQARPEPDALRSASALRAQASEWISMLARSPSGAPSGRRCLHEWLTQPFNSARCRRPGL